jgi:hypothetical protein
MEIADALAAVSSSSQSAQIRYGVVTGVSGSQVIVSVEGTSMTLRRNALYATPVAGHQVLIIAQNGRWTVLCNLA